MTEDKKNIARTAQLAVVEYKPASGSPPTYPAQWIPIWEAKVDQVTINSGAKPSTATIWFPSLRWHLPAPIKKGDMLRIRTDHSRVVNQSVIFTGFATADLVESSGGSDQSAGYERNAIIAQDFCWLLAATNPIYGQVARGPDDYTGYGTSEQAPIPAQATFLSGRRAIFNENGKPNCDAVELVMTSPNNKGYQFEIPIFAESQKIETSAVKFWTALQMLRYIFSPLYNRSFSVFPWLDISNFYGLNHKDFDKVPHHVVIDSLNVIEAAEVICRQLGWSFRQADIAEPGSPWLEFYKLGRASGYARSNDQITILHQLYAPQEAQDIRPAVERGEKMLWAFTAQKDIASVINQPIGLGAPDRFEITAELVPAWLDDDLEPDVGDDLFLTQAQIQALSNPNSKDYYKYYHVAGSGFKRTVGRKWALNEAGDYSVADYDRGLPFKFEDVIPSEYVWKEMYNSYGTKYYKRQYAAFRRSLLACLTLNKDSLSSVGIKVEFSFDGGSTWHVIPAKISSLPDEAGIYIDEENLAEMLHPHGSTISGGDLDGVELNYWTSLCDDIVNNRSYKDGEWKTRVRVTASVQMDQRLITYSLRQPASGSPFNHAAVYDFSGKYGVVKRTTSSSYSSTDLTAWDVDSTKKSQQHLDSIRDANQDTSICGQFTLDRLWLGDGIGEADFMVGDCIEKIIGREYSLAANIAGTTSVYPEIIQVIYNFDRQMTKLITRDLRFAEVRLT